MNLLKTVRYVTDARSDNVAKWIVGAIVAFVLTALTSLAALITHVLISIKTASWVLLVVGSIIFPVGIVHGVATWFGFHTPSSVQAQ